MLSHRLLSKPWIVGVYLFGVSTSNVIAAHIPGQAQLGGWVYIDRNNDGVLAFSSQLNPEYTIGEVRISLFSQVGNAETLVAMTASDEFGRYLFENIDPGTYVLRETPPIEYVDGADTLGVLFSLNGQPIPGNASAGSASDNTFFNIALTADVGGEFYNFGERGLAAGFVAKRFLFASLPEMSPPRPPQPEQFPEPTSLVAALMACCGGALAASRSRRSKRCVLQSSVRTADEL